MPLSDYVQAKNPLLRFWHFRHPWRSDERYPAMAWMPRSWVDGGCSALQLRVPLRCIVPYCDRNFVIPSRHTRAGHGVRLYQCHGCRMHGSVHGCADAGSVVP